MNDGTVLVTGATGTIGRELLPQLLSTGATVRALTRNPDADLPGHVEVAVADLSRPDTLTAAVDGVRAVFLLTGGPDGPTQDANLVAAAERAGVAHIVKLSVLSAGHRTADPITRWHLAGERTVRDSGLTWTFLRPNGFMSNALGWAGTISGQGTVYAPHANGRTSLVDPADIAAVAVAALTRPGHEQHAYPLTGPQALTPAEQVHVLAGVLDRPLRYVEVPPDAVRDGMTSAGMPAQLADAVLETLAHALGPEAGTVDPTVEQVTGRAPATFGQWARRNAPAFGVS